MANLIKEQEQSEQYPTLDPQAFSIWKLQQLLGQEKQTPRGISSSKYGQGETIYLGNRQAGDAGLEIALYTHVLSDKDDTAHQKSLPSLRAEGGSWEMSGQLGLYFDDDGSISSVDRVESIYLMPDGVVFKGTVGKNRAELRLYRDGKRTYTTELSEHPELIPDQEEEVRKLEGPRISMEERSEKLRRLAAQYLETQQK